MTQLGTGNNRKRTVLTLVVGTALAAALFSTVALTAPAYKPPTVVMESGSGSLEALGFNVVDDVEFAYDEVRHVSLTIAYYSEDEGVLADLFAGPIWGDGMRSKYVWDTSFSQIRHEDDFDYFDEAKTVEFDADHWKIELRSLSGSEKYVRYMYTVTYPKP